MGALPVRSIIFMTSIHEQLHDKVVYHAFSFHTGSSDIVKVCHMRDPSSFYVHRVADCMTLENLCLQLSKHLHTFSTPPQSVLKGKYKVTILVYYGDFHSGKTVKTDEGIPKNPIDCSIFTSLKSVLYLSYKFA
jgi:hypothetical protein